METKNPEEIRRSVRNRYGEIAKKETSGCGCSALSSCCGTSLGPIEKMSQAFGYTKEQTDSAPEGANMGLGCGNPVALASLKPGETVVDLGSGGGFDCFLAAKQVGDTGRVIGVDMTPDMVSKARANAKKIGANTVEFRLGEIEHLPLADNSADIIMSNCVINLSPDKQMVYGDAFRVLKPGGRAFHYIGDPESKSGRRTTAGVIRRLEQVGFSHVHRDPRAFGVVAVK